MVKREAFTQNYREVECFICKQKYFKPIFRIQETEKRGGKHCCSQVCTVQSMTLKRQEKWSDVETVFWSHVDKSPGQGPNGDCWVWTGVINNVSNYGYMMVKGKQKRAHRLSYEFNKGMIPIELIVMHKCDNKVCVNPEHLELGTLRQNSEDATLKGLQEKGEDRYNSKLTEEKVKEIRQKYAAGGYSQKQLAREYNISQRLVWAIVHRTRWKHVD